MQVAAFRLDSCLQIDMEELVSEKKMKEEVLEDIESIGEELPDVEGAIEEDTLERQLADALADAAEQKDLFFRVSAEFENYKKRMIREKAMAMKYAGEPVIREILPTIDNLERAIAQGQVEGIDAEK